LPVPFDDIGRDRKSRASQVPAKRYKLSAPYLQRRAMDIERE
jgi:hypothetical protein